MIFCTRSPQRWFEILGRTKLQDLRLEVSRNRKMVKHVDSRVGLRVTFIQFRYKLGRDDTGRAYGIATPMNGKILERGTLKEVHS